PFRRTAAVVRNRGDVLDRADLEPGRLQRTDRGFPARARTLDEDVDLAHPMLLRAACGGLGSHLRGERSGLPRPLEPDLSGTGPGDHRAGRVGDAHNRVVEGALDVRVPVDDVLLLFAAHLAPGALTALRRHSLLPR